MSSSPQTPSPAAHLPPPLRDLQEASSIVPGAMHLITARTNGAIASSIKPPAVNAAGNAENNGLVVADSLEHRGNSEESPAGDTKTGDTLTSLELEAEGEYENTSTSNVDSGCESSPTICNRPARTPTPRSKKKKRNKLRQLSTDPPSQYLCNLDVAVDMRSPRPTAFQSSNKRASMGVTFAGGRGQLVADEGSSPSTILPGNALQLHLDDGKTSQNGTLVLTPSPSPTSTTSSASPGKHGKIPSLSSTTSDESNPTTTPAVVVITPADEPTAANTTTTSRPTARVHFRSRVRIASGLHSGHGSHNNHHHDRRHRRSTDDQATSTTASSSPSSSISAPLRYQPDENNTLGPLGRRLSSLAQSRRRRLDDEYDARRRDGFTGYDHYGSERTPFLRAAAGVPGGTSNIPDYTRQRRRRYVEGIGRREGAWEEDEDPVPSLKREEEIIFGRWPWRAFNRHWWWYQCEPLLCCCSDEFDDQ